MRPRTTVRALPFAMLVAIAPAASLAQPSATDQALAAALFADGQKLLDDGKVAEACAKLAESHRLEPLLGTLLNLAYCHEKEGKTASAWIEFTTVAERAAKAKEAARTKFAREHAGALEKRLSRLTIDITRARPEGRDAAINVAAREGVNVRLDGKALGVAAVGTAMPLDPGEHLVEVAAPGKKTWSQKVRIEPGPSARTVEVPALEDEAAPPVAPVAPPPVAPAAPPPAAPAVPVTPPPAAPADSSRGARFVSGLVVGGIGLVGVGVGAAFGVRTFQKKADIAGNCDAADVCNKTGYSIGQDAHAAATVSTIAFAAGLVATAVGLGLVISGLPKKAAPASAWIVPAVGPGHASLSAGFAF